MTRTPPPDQASRPAYVISEAYRIADDVLYPAAAAVDRTGLIPPSHWSELARAGLFGIAAPVADGGPGLDLTQVCEIQEVLASGCLATAFTWLQHHGVVLSLAGTSNSALRAQLLPELTTGRLRAGVAYAGVVPTTPRMIATRTPTGWRLDGEAPFVSGWGSVDVIQISARDTDSDDVIAAIISTREAPATITSTMVDLVAAAATQTAFLRIDGLEVPDSQIVSRVAYRDFLANQTTGLRINGTLAFGIVRRATALLDRLDRPRAARALRERAGVIRARLDEALGSGPEGDRVAGNREAMLDARADGARLALEATAALVAARGGPALLSGSDSERLSREALFTLVAASRPQVKELLVERFSDPEHQ